MLISLLLCNIWYTNIKHPGAIVGLSLGLSLGLYLLINCNLCSAVYKAYTCMYLIIIIIFIFLTYKINIFLLYFVDIRYKLTTKFDS